MEEQKNTATTSISDGILKVYSLIEKWGMLIIGPFFLTAIVREIIDDFIPNISKGTFLGLGIFIGVAYGFSVSKDLMQSNYNR